MKRNLLENWHDILVNSFSNVFIFRASDLMWKRTFFETSHQPLDYNKHLLKVTKRC